ncbi:erythrocyte binding protein-like [Hordeum vulgare]|nr:erythrocyte binding protein-like [Hordeum vulgare]
MADHAVPLHIHALLSGVLPPFSSFLTAVLSHYYIHELHLDPSSLVLLSAFAFLCEAFVGVTPSVALLRDFFSLEVVSEEQCTRCASLKSANASVSRALDAKLLSKAEGFQR